MRLNPGLKYMNKRYVKFSIIRPDYRLMLSLMLILFLSTTLLCCTMPFEVQANASGATEQSSALLIDNSGFLLTYSGLTIEKLASPSTYSDVGDLIVYTYKVTNKGNLTITAPITVTDNKTGTINITENLGPGQNISVNSTYDITYKDLNEGYVTNSAFAIGKLECLQIVSNTDTETIKEVQSPHLIIEKSAYPATYDHVGQVITYIYNITNSRKAVITGPIKVTDNKTGIINVTQGNLTSGQSVLGNSTYVITQKDIDNGFVTNSAFATGTIGNNTTVSNVDNETVIAVQLPALLIKKLAAPTNYSFAGQVITYSYNVTNTGNVNITAPIKVIDNITGIINATEESLAPGQSLFVNSTYVIKQADIYSGSVTNSAFATGKFGNNTTTSNIDNETVIADKIPKLIIEKSANPRNYSSIGQVITYFYNVTNTGNVNITGPIKVIDNKTGIINITEENLIPGRTVTGSANHTIVQDDIDSGSITNSAFATGTIENNTITSEPDNETVTAEQNPALFLDKSAYPSTYSTAGSIITYTYNITNTGNVIVLGPIKVTDNKTGIINVTEGNLTPRQSIIGTANYTITGADLDNGSVTNEAYATGTFNGSNVTSNTDNNSGFLINSAYPNGKFNRRSVISNTDRETVIAQLNPALIIEKSASPTSYSSVGQMIKYTYNVTNAGNANITGPIRVTDNKTGIINVTGGDLVPGQSVLASSTYIIKKEDLDSGSVTNLAFATGTFKNNTTTSNTDSETVTIQEEESPAYCISKSIIGTDEAGDCITNDPGDVIKYRVIVKNEGNVDLTDVSVKDSLIKLEGPEGDDIDPGILNPGEVWKFYGEYRVTQKDIDSNGDGDGYIENTATVRCKELPEQKSTAKQPILQKTDLSIYKSAIGTDEAGDGIINEPGDIIQYQVIVKNEGNKDLTGIEVEDPLIKLTGPTGKETDSGKLNSEILKPGEIWKYTGNYIVTQKDLNSNGEGDGLIENTVTVDCDQLEPKSDSAEVPVHAIPIYLIDKTVTDVAGKGPTGNITAAGQRITYRINVRNVGNVDLTDVLVQDSLIKLEGPSGDNSPAGILNVGETWTYTGNYQVTQEDINSNGNGDGFIENTATVSCNELPDKTSRVKQQIVLNTTLKTDPVNHENNNKNSPKSSSSSSKGGSGELTTSPEPAKNIETKESVQAYVTNGKNVRFEFINNATCVVYVSFDAKKTAGKITTIAEMLKGKSELVSQLPTGEVYKSFNIWVGSNGFAIDRNIDNAVVYFRVEKNWIKDKKIGKESIILNRYATATKKWEELPTTPSGEDEEFLYFVAKTPEFGSFVITAEKSQNLNSNIKDIGPSVKETASGEDSSNTKENIEKEQKQAQKIPGFDMVLSIAAIFAALIYKGNRKY